MRPKTDLMFCFDGRTVSRVKGRERAWRAGLIGIVVWVAEGKGRLRLGKKLLTGRFGRDAPLEDIVDVV